MPARQANTQDTSVSPEAFPPTHWTLVIGAARGGSCRAEQALEELCKSYWRPLNAFIRRSGYTVEQAEDLTQEFFARLLQKNVLQGITQEGGKFRSYLLTALKRFLATEWHRQNAKKRGGGSPHLSMDDLAGGEFACSAAGSATPEMVFEREWAKTVMDGALNRLREEYGRAKKLELFQHLQSCLSGAETSIPYARIAAVLRTTEGGLRVAVHRMRRRYGELLRAEIGETVSSPDEIDEEIRHLIRVASNQTPL